MAATSINNLVNPQYKNMVYLAAGVVVLSALALTVPVQAINIIGLMTLTGVGYGIANDMFACRDCIEYFTVGHFYDGRNLRNRPILTLNPNLNAVVWGTIATWWAAAAAGAVFAFLARVPFWGLPFKITAIQLAPWLVIGAALTILIAHSISRAAQKSMQEAVDTKDNERQRYQGVPEQLQAGWEACNARNSTGYEALAGLSVVLCVGEVAARILFSGHWIFLLLASGALIAAAGHNVHQRGGLAY